MSDLIQFEEKDIPALITYLKRDVFHLTFVIQDIKDLKLQPPNQTVWVQMSPNNEIEAAIIHQNQPSKGDCYVHSEIPDKMAAEKIAILLNDMFKNGQIQYLSMATPVFKMLETHLVYNVPMYDSYTLRFDRFNRHKESIIDAKLHDAEIAGKRDLQDLIGFYRRVAKEEPEVSSGDANIQEIQNNIEGDLNPVAFVRENETGKIVSAAKISVENDDSGCVTAVATEKKYRHRGYASSCIYRLIQDLSNKRKEVFIGYGPKEPHLERLYGKLGFEFMRTNMVIMAKD